MEVLKFIFGGVWTFFGVLLLIAVTLEGIADCIKAIRGKK